MKTLIACYSFTGNTLKAAESLKKATGADLVRIEPVKDTNYLMKCVNALLKRRTPIKPCTTDLRGYDAVVICTPVWASSAPPGVNQYMDELKNADGKKFAVLVSYGGSGDKSVVSQVRAALESKKMTFIDALAIRSSETVSFDALAARLK